MLIKRLDSGKQIINFSNVDFVKVKKIDDELKLFYEYRPKIKTEELEIRRNFQTLAEMDSFMKEVHFSRLDEYYINIHNISVADETPLDHNKIKVKLYMKYNQPIEIVSKRDIWYNFKNNQLV